MTEERIARVTKEWSQLAGDSLRIEAIGGAIYAFGSELACLRLHYKMRVGEVKFSENLQSWFYSKELVFTS
jgi:hypothetical protein